MSWSNQPVCGACWQAYSYGKHGEVRPAVTIKEEFRTQDVCCFCSGEAAQGIYLRVETAKMPFPTPSADLLP